jgi:hypothetical protein
MDVMRRVNGKSHRVAMNQRKGIAAVPAYNRTNSAGDVCKRIFPTNRCKFAWPTDTPNGGQKAIRVIGNVSNRHAFDADMALRMRVIKVGLDSDDFAAFDARNKTTIGFAQPR